MLPAATDPNPNALDQLAVDLRVSLLRTARRLRAQKSVDELSDAQFSVLAHLFTQGPRTPGELAEAEHVRPPSMTRTIAGLVEQGLVTRTDHPDDGRQVLISVTAGGREVVEEMAEIAAKMGIEDFDRVYGINDLASGDVIFSATGVTDGAMLQGVHKNADSAETHSIVMRSMTGTVREIITRHNFTQKPSAD